MYLSRHSCWRSDNAGTPAGSKVTSPASVRWSSLTRPRCVPCFRATAVTHAPGSHTCTVAAELILALDQGTTSSRALLTYASGAVLSLAQQELPASYPHSGWVEQDPEDIFSGQLQEARQALADAGAVAADLAAVGITNERETTLLWDRATGRSEEHTSELQSRG